MKPAGRGAAPADLLFALLCALLVLALSALAYWRAEQNPPENRVAVGILADPHHIAMGAVYGSFAREAAEGGTWMVHNHQTAEPHAPALARPWDYAIGRLGGALGGNPQLFFRLDRWFAVPLFALGVMLLLCELIERRVVRRLGLLAAMLGGNLYWLVLLAGQHGALAQYCSTWLDTYHERLTGLGFSYPALLLGVPHLALEIACFAAGLACILRSARQRSLAQALLAGLTLLLLASVRPYSVPVLLLAALALYAPAWRAPRTWWALLLIALPVLPLLAHQALALRVGQPFAALQVEHPAPPPQELLLFAGLPALVALLLLVPALRARRKELAWSRGAEASGVRRALWGWAAGSLLLTHGGALVPWEVEAFTPVPLLCLLLALFAVESLRSQRLSVVLLALHLVPTLFYAREVWLKLENPQSAYWITSGEQQAFEWLSNSRGSRLAADTPALVLACDPQLATLAPWLAGVRVLAGHPDHTLSFDSKLEALRAFLRYGGGLAALAELGCTHVLFGPRESQLSASGTGWDPQTQRFLEVVADCGDVRVFRLQQR